MATPNEPLKLVQTPPGKWEVLDVNPGKRTKDDGTEVEFTMVAMRNEADGHLLFTEAPGRWTKAQLQGQQKGEA